MKYGRNFRVEYINGSMCFSSGGKELKHFLENYTQPFISDNKSFDMGLYIAKEILNMHKLELKYTYNAGVNSFCLHV